MSEVADRLHRILRMALAEGDRNLVAEVEREMARLGIPEAAVPTMAERAVPPRPRGRPRKNP